MRLTRPVIAFIKKNIDFLRKGRLSSHEMLENNVKYRITMISSYYFIELLVVAQKERVIGNETYKA